MYKHEFDVFHTTNRHSFHRFIFNRELPRRSQDLDRTRRRALATLADLDSGGRTLLTNLAKAQESILSKGKEVEKLLEAKKDLETTKKARKNPYSFQLSFNSINCFRSGSLLLRCADGCWIFATDTNQHQTTLSTFIGWETISTTNWRFYLMFQSG